MAHDVSVVGLTILDILGRPVERIPDGGNVEFIDEIRLTLAGTAGGTVVDCAKLGLKSMLVGAVGDDEKADFILATLDRFGIDKSCMQRVAGPTSATMLNVRPNGDRPALHVRGASDKLDVPESDYPRIFDARFVHMGGTGLLAAMDGAPTATFLEQAKRHGCTTTFDLIAATAETIELVRPALPHIDYFMPSIEEARAMSGREEVGEVARFFLDLGAQVCVFTMGGEGSYIATADGGFRVPAFEVEVSDTTGCGDGYCAGFIAGLSQGWDLEQSARLATAASALIATGLGSDAGIKSLEQTIDAMNRFKVRDA